MADTIPGAGRYCQALAVEFYESAAQSGYDVGMRIDLHCHSTASDGQLTPSELVQRAHTMQIDYLALTDHDTVAGLDEARAAAASLPAKSAPAILNGVEISCRWQGFEIHILGWQFDAEHAAMRNLLDAQMQRRAERAGQIEQKLLQAGVSETALAPIRQNRGRNLTRKHFADALLGAGIVDSIDNAFRRYLGRGQCAYVQPQWCSIEEAVAAIKGAGGSAGLAHPLAYQLSTKWLKRLLHAFCEAGGDALEVVSSQQAPHQRTQLAELAKDFKLQSSVGSDFHAPSAWRELGRNLTLPDGSDAVWSDWALVN
ncbi:PHP domain-containing protein [Aliidiomarina sp. Khilg15.8]